MITQNNFISVLRRLGFNNNEDADIWEKSFGDHNCILKADLSKNEPIYPNEIKSEGDFTKNFYQPESYVVFVCVAKLLTIGYRPEHIVLEKTWTLGHTQKSGRADISVFDETGKQILLIIECKQAGQKYIQARKDLFINKEGKQLFSYKAQARSAKWLQLYAADYDEDNDVIIDFEEIVKCHDDKNVETLAKQDNSILLYKAASEAPDIYRVWDETYNKRTYKGLVFGENTQAYKIGVRPLRKSDLRRFNKEESISNSFLEILRHNSISDKENAFNKLLSLFICKLVDEKEKSDSDIVDFQYKEGTDDYFTLYERLLRLFHYGMDKFLKEDVFYLEDSYITETLSQYTGKKRKYLEEELKRSFQRTKLLSCQVFAFREIYNEKLFMQNGKVLVEMVELFQNYRLSYSSKEQFLGELFEQLLSHGFKQDEGQFFTPIPIARFIWNSIPYERFVNTETMSLPKVIDYACGAGHFLTEGISAISDYISHYIQEESEKEKRDEIVSKTFYGIEKDNRLARVSKIALLLNGANEAHIKAMDGLNHDESFLGERNSFDILVANPPYSVDDFKVHLERKLFHQYEVLDYMPTSSDDIEYVFIERIGHLLKPGGIAAVVLPNWVLITEDAPTKKVREIILKNFVIICISSFGGKTFGKTNTPTFVLFMVKKDSIPNKSEILKDSIDAIFNNEKLTDWEDKQIFESYIEMIGVDSEDYVHFRNKIASMDELIKHPYFKQYVDSFNKESSILNLKKTTSYKKLSEDKQNALIQSKFYDKYIQLEKEKVYYFALTSQQNVMLINPPKENDTQKRYLGYSFVNRNKKDVLVESEGLLSDINNRNNSDKMAWAVKEAFFNRQISNELLTPYITYTKLSSLLNFSREKFYITISQVLPESIKSSYSFIRLDDEDYFTLSIGNRVLNNELVDNGEIPVYSANVRDIFGYLDSENLSDYSKPSVLWGIDGEWLVNYIPAGVKFYPTDHCGYLRVNCEGLNTYYIGMIMYIIGCHHNFSRSYRAAIDRVKGLKIPCPPKKIQDKVAKECLSIEEKYKISRSMTMEDYRNQITTIMKKYKVILFGENLEYKPEPPSTQQPPIVKSK